jgi:hypothetical protein
MMPPDDEAKDHLHENKGNMLNKVNSVRSKTEKRFFHGQKK